MFPIQPRKLLAQHPLPNPLQLAVQEIAAGRPVILTDDAGRENEADLVMAAESVSVEWMARFIRDCSGIVCLCLDHATADRLQLNPMSPRNTSAHGTPFTVSIEARDGVSTGVSAADRVHTVLTAVRDGASADALVRPGHVFPLRAHDRRVLGRRGHTEGSVLLAELAGCKPAAILCELMNEDGTMMRGEALAGYAARHGLLSVSVAELADYLEQAAGTPANEAPRCVATV